VTELRAGVHVIGNADPEAGPAPKIERVKAAVEGIVPADSGENGKSGESGGKGHGGDSESGARDAVLEGLAAVCREHLTEERGISDTCVHLDLYGTRSSLLLWMDDERRASRLLYADGPPCEVEYEDFSPLLHEQSQTASYRPGEIAARTGS
jgi:hypothetical protein